MKKIFKFFMSFLFLVLALNANESNTAQTSAEKVLKVGIKPDYKPFEYIKINFEIDGFDIALLKELANKVGFKFELVDMEFDDLIPSLESGKIDMVISAMSITPQRAERVSFSKPYFVVTDVYIKKSTNDKITDKASMAQKNIGVQEKTTQEEKAKNIPNANIKSYSNTETAILDLKNNNLDIVLIDNIAGINYVKSNSDLTIALEEDDKIDEIAIAFPKDTDENFIKSINLAIDEIIESDFYDNLLKKYNLVIE